MAPSHFTIAQRQSALGPPAESPFVPYPFEELLKLESLGSQKSRASELPSGERTTEDGLRQVSAFEMDLPVLDNDYLKTFAKTKESRRDELVQRFESDPRNPSNMVDAQQYAKTISDEENYGITPKLIHNKNQIEKVTAAKYNDTNYENSSWRWFNVNKKKFEYAIGQNSLDFNSPDVGKSIPYLELENDIAEVSSHLNRLDFISEGFKGMEKSGALSKADLLLGKDTKVTNLGTEGEDYLISVTSSGKSRPRVEAVFNTIMNSSEMRTDIDKQLEEKNFLADLNNKPFDRAIEKEAIVDDLLKNAISKYVHADVDRKITVESYAKGRAKAALKDEEPSRPIHEIEYQVKGTLYKNMGEIVSAKKANLESVSILEERKKNFIARNKDYNTMDEFKKFDNAIFQLHEENKNIEKYQNYIKSQARENPDDSTKALVRVIGLRAHKAAKAAGLSDEEAMNVYNKEIKDAWQDDQTYLPQYNRMFAKDIEPKLESYKTVKFKSIKLNESLEKDLYDGYRFKKIYDSNTGKPLSFEEGSYTDISGDPYTITTKEGEEQEERISRESINNLGINFHPDHGIIVNFTGTLSDGKQTKPFFVPVSDLKETFSKAVSKGEYEEDLRRVAYDAFEYANKNRHASVDFFGTRLKVLAKSDVRGASDKEKVELVYAVKGETKPRKEVYDGFESAFQVILSLYKGK